MYQLIIIFSISLSLLNSLIILVENSESSLCRFMVNIFLLFSLSSLYFLLFIGVILSYFEKVMLIPVVKKVIPELLIYCYLTFDIDRYF